MTPEKEPGLACILKENASRVADFRVVTGFDAFVDEMVTLVAERRDQERFQPVTTIAEFGQRIAASAGHSSLSEIVVREAAAGGCAINMGDALADLGVQVHTFATFGEPVHPVFAKYLSKAKGESWGRHPGRTIAFEFTDGKCMFSAVSQLAEFTPDDVLNRLEDGKFQAACASADLIAFTDWTLFPHMTDCWRVLADRVLQKLKKETPLIIDLVDPSSRTEADIRDMLATLRFINEETCPVTLGLNQNEANLLARFVGSETMREANRENTVRLGDDLRRKLQVSEVVIHARTFAAFSDQETTTSIDWTPCENPIKSTGAGDRFNAGYALGKMLDLDPTSRLQLACASSFLYVKLGRSTSLDELVSFLKESMSNHSSTEGS